MNTIKADAHVADEPTSTQGLATDDQDDLLSRSLRNLGTVLTEGDPTDEATLRFAQALRRMRSDPAEAARVDALARRLNAATAESSAEPDEIVDAYRELGRGIASLRTTAAPRVPVEQMLGLDHAQTELEGQLAEATVEVLSMMPGSSIRLPPFKTLQTIFDEVALGVRTRVLHNASVRSDPDAVPYALWLADRGIEVRVSPSVTRRLLVVDGRTAVIPLGHDDRGVLHVREPALIDQLTALFEVLWSDAVPLASPTPAADPQGLSPTDRHLLRLLASGLADDAVAKRLGISARTVRRIMADLMDRLGADSRFEAGVEAARRGWV